jgi:hypothetical protein
MKIIETIKESCQCGAMFEISGDFVFCRNRYTEFLEAHATCRNLQESKILEKLEEIRCGIIDVETEAAKFRTITMKDPSG